MKIAITCLSLACLACIAFLCLTGCSVAPSASSTSSSSEADTSTPPETPPGFTAYVEACVPAGYHYSGTDEAWHDATTASQVAGAQVWLRDQWGGNDPTSAKCLPIGACTSTYAPVDASSFRYDATASRLFVTCKGAPGEMAIVFLPTN